MSNQSAGRNTEGSSSQPVNHSAAENSNQSANHNVEGSNTTEKLFTEEQVKKILSSVMRRLGGLQLRTELPQEILRDLNAPKLQERVDKYKDSYPRYDNEEWAPLSKEDKEEEDDYDIVEEEPEHDDRTYEVTVKAGDLIADANRLTETIRVQACSAAKIYERLKQIPDSTLPPDDKVLFMEAVEHTRKLAVFGFGFANLEDKETNRLVAKANNLPPYQNHMYVHPNDGKSYLLNEQQMDQIFEARCQQELLESFTRDNNNRGRGRGRGRGRRGRRGRGHWSQHNNYNNNYNDSDNFSMASDSTYY